MNTRDIRNLDRKLEYIFSDLNKNGHVVGWVNTPLIPAWQRQRLGDLCKSEITLIYMSIRPHWTIQLDFDSNKKATYM